MYKIKAFGKVNLLLNVIEKREDNYHNIETLFQSIDLYDDILLKESKEFNIVSNNKNIPLNESNTLIKAYNSFKSLYRGNFVEFDIQLFKNIPIGAGLGGSSADGAALLRFLNNYYNNPFNDKALSKLALNIGADIPFLLKGGTAKGELLGEKLYFYNIDFIEDFSIVIIFPNIEISTKWAYENITNYLTKSANSFNINNSNKSNFIRSLKKSYNIFENLIFEYYPRIKNIKQRMLELKPVTCMLTGTGSSVFGIFDRPIDKKQIGNVFSGNMIYITKLLSQNSVKRNFQTTM